MKTLAAIRRFEATKLMPVVVKATQIDATQAVRDEAAVMYDQIAVARERLGDAAGAASCRSNAADFRRSR